MEEVLLIRVRSKGMHGSDRNIYKNDIDIRNPKLLAIIFEDLELMFNAPIKKAVALMNKDTTQSIFSP
jgi:hypothetical protein